MFLLIIFSIFTIALIALIVYKIVTGDLHGKDWPIFPILAFFIFMIFVSYNIYKKGALSYLVDDYGFTYQGEKDGADRYIKGSIVVSYSSGSLQSSTYVYDKLSNDMDTKFHFEFLNKKFKFNDSVNMIFEYLTNDINDSKEIMLYGDHKHVTIGYNHLDKEFYYEIIEEYKEHRTYRGSGEDREEIVEKNPNYDKYKDYKVIFKKYNELDMETYERIAKKILGSFYLRARNHESSNDMTFYK